MFFGLVLHVRLFLLPAVKRAVFGRFRTCDEYFKLLVRTVGRGELAGFFINVDADDAARNRENFGRYVLQRLLGVLGKNGRCPVGVRRRNRFALVKTDPYGGRKLRRIPDQPSVGIGRPVLPATGRFMMEDTRLPVPPDSNTLSIRCVST